MMITVFWDVPVPARSAPSIQHCVVDAIVAVEARCAQPALIFVICGEFALQRHSPSGLGKDVLGLAGNDGYKGPADADT